MNIKKLLTGSAVLAMLVGCAGTTLRVMNTGLGSGAVVSNPAGLNCTRDCEHRFPRNSSVTLTAAPVAGSQFVEWGGDCAGAAPGCTVVLSELRSASAKFQLTALPVISAGPLSGEAIRDFLLVNPAINTPGRFLAAIGDLPAPFRFRDNWILMARSESLQTGHARSPRLLLPSQDARQIFSFALSADPGYPHADPNKIEYIHFDDTGKRFRFHEIDVAARTVTLDARGCAECHAARPNWDAYDSWGGMLPFNRDRVYKGSIDAAALRATFSLKGKPNEMREVLEQLNLPELTMQRQRGGLFDGWVKFPTLDDTALVIVEPQVSTLSGTTSRSITYPSPPAASAVKQGGAFFHLFNSVVLPAGQGDVAVNAEGRGVDLFDQLTPLNGQRIAQELIDHPRSPVDVRPIALAIADGANVTATLSTAQRDFFNARNRVADFAAMDTDTTQRRRLQPKLKVDLQRQALLGPNGLIEAHGDFTAAGKSASESRIRQETFRRPLDAGVGADDVNTGAFVDRETIANDVAQFRYLLEPLGIAVGKWSMSVAGRSRTYAFADLFSTTTRPNIASGLRVSLNANKPAACPSLNTASPSSVAACIQAQLAALPAANEAPSYAQVQNIFDRQCLQCHGSFSVQGGPYAPSLVASLSHSQLLRPPAPTAARVIPGNPNASVLFQRISTGTMPPQHNGPALSGAEVDLIRRWITAGAIDIPSGATQNPPSAQCQRLLDQLDALGDSASDLQRELRDAAPGAKARIAAQIKQIKALEQTARQLGCALP